MGPFVQVILGQIISLFGNAALRFVLPLILLRQTGSAAVYGAATALALLPALAGTLAGGVLADRCRNKARLMAALDLAAAGLALGAAASADNLPIVLWAPAALCALYALQGLYQPVVRASLPLLLAGDRLVQGNAVIQLVDTLDELLGPLLGSALLVWIGAGAPAGAVWGLLFRFRSVGVADPHPRRPAAATYARKTGFCGRPAGEPYLSVPQPAGIAAADGHHGVGEPCGDPGGGSGHPGGDRAVPGAERCRAGGRSGRVERGRPCRRSAGRPQPTPTVRPAGPGASAGHCRAVRRHGRRALGTTACLRRGGPVRLLG